LVRGTSFRRISSFFWRCIRIDIQQHDDDDSPFPVYRHGGDDCHSRYFRGEAFVKSNFGNPEWERGVAALPPVVSVFGLASPSQSVKTPSTDQKSAEQRFESYPEIDLFVEEG